ncbi:MAG: hypothetical protein ACK5Q5_24115 [Planctomycetaceae bacterium]
MNQLPPRQRRPKRKPEGKSKQTAGKSMAWLGYAVLGVLVCAVIGGIAWGVKTVWPKLQAASRPSPTVSPVDAAGSSAASNEIPPPSNPRIAVTANDYSSDPALQSRLTEEITVHSKFHLKCPPEFRLTKATIQDGSVDGKFEWTGENAPYTVATFIVEPWPPDWSRGALMANIEQNHLMESPPHTTFERCTVRGLPAMRETSDIRPSNGTDLASRFYVVYGPSSITTLLITVKGPFAAESFRLAEAAMLSIDPLGE